MCLASVIVLVVRKRDVLCLLWKTWQFLLQDDFSHVSSSTSTHALFFCILPWVRDIITLSFSVLYRHLLSCKPLSIRITSLFVCYSVRTHTTELMTNTETFIFAWFLGPQVQEQCWRGGYFLLRLLLACGWLLSLCPQESSPVCILSVLITSTCEDETNILDLTLMSPFNLITSTEFLSPKPVTFWKTKGYNFDTWI